MKYVIIARIEMIETCMRIFQVFLAAQFQTSVFHFRNMLCFSFSLMQVFLTLFVVLVSKCITVFGFIFI